MSRVIFSLDNVTYPDVVALNKNLPIWGVKIKPEFLMENGYAVVDFFKSKNLKVMLDNKLFDTKDSMNDQITKYVSRGIDLVTVHASALFKPEEDLLLDHIVGVTVLTTFKDAQTIKIYKKWSKDAAAFLVEEIKQLGYKNIVCSSQDLQTMNVNSFSMHKFCPGIRPPWYKKEDDQNRKNTPAEAIQQGADYCIIGRPLTQFIKDPDKLLEKICSINEEIKKVTH